MKRFLTMTALAVLTTTAVFAQKLPAVAHNFASDQQTIAVMANTSGVGGAQFRTSVSLFNPTASAFAVTASLYDAAGTKHDAQINLAAGELKTFSNFLGDVFNYTGGGSVVFKGADTSRRFILSADVWAGASGRYSTSIPASEFAGSSSRSFAAGISVDASSRTNVGCMNQSGNANAVQVTILDSTGQQTIGTQTLNLLPNAWAQAGVTSVVSNGTVRFDPADAALCYAVVVDNSTNDGRYIPAAEYQP